MDDKAGMILIHYRYIIENRLFDEYDVLGFLIFIREYISDTEYPYIREFSHLVAHRGRDRGCVNSCIVAAIENDYRTKHESNEVEGYRGMEYQKWKDEWKNLGEEYGIVIDDEIIGELTLCVFSLAQFTNYIDKKGRGRGRIELFFGKDRSLALVTTEGESDSLYVCFSKFGCFELCRDIPGGYLENVVETIRINGRLRLRDTKGFII